MTDPMAAAIQSMRSDSARIVYGVATGTNTVQVMGAATAVTLPAIAAVHSGDYCAVLVQGADRLILGPIGVGTSFDTWEPTITQGSAVSGSFSHGWSLKRPDGSFFGSFKWTASGSGTAANDILMSVPYTLPDQTSIGGSFHFLDSGSSQVYEGNITDYWTTSFGAFVTGGATRFGQSVTIASPDQIIVWAYGRWI